MKQIIFFTLLAAFSAHGQTATPGTQKRLEALRQGYEAAVARQVGASHAVAVKDLNAKYAAALDRLILAASQGGRLDDALALRDEKRRLADGTPLPDSDADVAVVLQPLRQTYRDQSAALIAIRDKAGAPLASRYQKELETLQADCTKASLLDDALVVRKVRESLGQGEAQLSPASAPASDSSSSGRVSQAKDDPDKTRALLEWCVRQKARVRLLEGSKLTSYDRLTEMPRKDAKLLLIMNHSFTGGLDFTQPTEAFPWQLLEEGASDIEHIEIWSIDPLVEDDVKAISTLEHLKSLLIKAPDTEPAVFQSLRLMPGVRQFDFKIAVPDGEAQIRFLLSRFPNLDSFSTSEGFKDDATGKALGSLPNLSVLHMNNGGVGPGFFESLASASRLNRLMIFSADPGPATASITSIKSLEGLVFHCPTSAPDLFDTFASLPRLRWVTLSLAGRNAKELQKLTRLKQIETLRLRDIPDDSALFFEALLDARSLRKLALSGPGVRDEMVSRLKGLKRLEELSVENSKVGRDTLNNLVKAIPKLKVVASVGPWN